MNELLIVPSVPGTPEIEITEEGRKLKGQLMIRSLSITKIDNPKTRDEAIAASSAIKTHLKDVEKSRQEVLKPFHDTTKMINSAASGHVTELENERLRLNCIVGDFELARRKEEELEAMRLASEVADLEKAAQPDPLKDMMGGAQKAESLERTLEAEERLQEASGKLSATLSSKGGNKAKGGALRQDWDVVVSDMKGLYAAHPQCVTLTANILAIKDLLRAGVKPPGIVAISKVSYSARSK